MDNLYKNYTFNRKSNGFTLVELIIVIPILGIISAIAVPRLVGYRSLVMKNVCDVNRNTVERLYNAFLIENDHKDINFDYFLNENFDEVCPAGGVIIYDEGKVKCSFHEDVNDDDVDEPPSDEVPWI